MKLSFLASEADPIRLEMMRQAHKAFTGRAIYCAGCQDILDCRRSVDITLRPMLEHPGQRSWPFADQRQDPIATYLLCGPCADKAIDAMRIKDSAGMRAEVIDGRILFAQPLSVPKRKATPVERDSTWRKVLRRLAVTRQGSYRATRTGAAQLGRDAGVSYQWAGIRTIRALERKGYIHVAPGRGGNRNGEIILTDLGRVWMET